MSPRAAWQLEAFGFSDVYDYADGKLDWIAHGFPVEGAGPHWAVAGEVADRDAVLACHLGDSISEISENMKAVTHDYCVVLNAHDIVIGRMRPKNLSSTNVEGAVEHVLEPGPTTVRPTESAKALLERMRKRKVPAVIVTTNKGRLLGAATQKALEGLLQRGSGDS